MPARDRVAVGRRGRESCRQRVFRSQLRGSRRVGSGAGSAGVRAADARDGRAVQPLERRGASRRSELRARDRVQPRGGCGRTGAVRGARDPRVRVEARPGPGWCRLLPGHDGGRVALGEGLVAGAVRARRGELRAAVAVRRRPRWRQGRRLSRGSDGSRERYGRRGRHAAAAHQQPAAGRQQRDAARRREAGLATAVAESGAAARAVSGARHRGDGFGRGARPGARRRRGRAPARGDRDVAAVRWWRGAVADARPGSRCTSLRARQRTFVRRDRGRQFPPGSQRLGCAVHGRTLSLDPRATQPRRRVLPVAAVASAGLDDAAQHRALVPDRVPRGRRVAGEQQPRDAGARSRHP